MPQVSIIVPVYNCREYLERCAASILGQTHRELQLILVDDGSQDGTGEICDALAAKDSRVTVIHQKNAGVSAARNAGLSAATGAFIGFVDADDYIDEKTYEIALSYADGCDIVMWDTVSIWDDGRTEPDTIPLLGSDCLLEKKDVTPPLLRQIAGSACRCLYPAELLQDVSFPVGIKLSEDRLFNLHAMGKMQKLHYLKRGLYLRYMNPTSAVNRYYGDRFEKNLMAMEVAAPLIKTYWGEAYLEGYTKMFVVGGALSAVYEICSRGFPGNSRITAIKKLAAQKELTEAFVKYSAQGLREKLLMKRAALGLLLVGILFNWKNR